MKRNSTSGTEYAAGGLLNGASAHAVERKLWFNDAMIAIRYRKLGMANLDEMNDDAPRFFSAKITLILTRHPASRVVKSMTFPAIGFLRS